ncbi:hypothetical protein HHI36_008039 [Cryptolaemus montrouzieri]|uniref:Cationic amino acid transporter C-terminal domain-containing protein n=1 Tax=Cryptolaemus montrouzieri TaxID=559131 RepID=A0ABD2MRD6_9CUCU
MELLEQLGFDRTMYLRPISWYSFKYALTRKKEVTFDSESKLSKVLSTLDLVALGIGSTLGAGIYVLAGDVAKHTSGPAIVISFLIAAIASVLAGLCYAEFGARVPKAGSAYVYTYVCIGEFCAFIIGWNLILEYLIGSATVTKAIFTYLDELTSKRMSDFFVHTVPIHVDGFGNYTDFFSLGLATLFSVGIAFGAKESSVINNIFTLVNLLVVSTVIISGFWKANPSLWNIKTGIPEGYGKGGFAPYGLKGIIKGAARCFFAFIGFDCIATAGEEAKNPQKSIPIGVVCSLIIVFLAYFGASGMITMMVPYYEQDTNAPLIYVYEKMNWPILKYLVSVGAICGLFASLLGAMFPLPRIIYAMASDGLIFKCLSRVHPKFHTPFMGTMIAGTIAGVLACLFDLEKLTNMMSIGTLFAYSMVAACVLVLRYREDQSVETTKSNKESTFYKKFIKEIICPQTRIPTKFSSKFVSNMIFLFVFLALVGSGIMKIFEENLNNGDVWLIIILGFILCTLFIILALVSMQPASSNILTFSVPFVPWIPGVSIMINIYLMTTLPNSTWTYYLGWMIIGLIIYFLYGFWNSQEGKEKNEQEEVEIHKF